MRRDFRHAVFAISFLALATGNILAQSSSRNSQWFSPATGNKLSMKVLESKGSLPGKPLPVIVYLENLATPRTGTDSDEAIIHDLLAEGYVVVTLDYAANLKARMP